MDFSTIILQLFPGTIGSNMCYIKINVSTLCYIRSPVILDQINIKYKYKYYFKYMLPKSV